MTANFRYLWNAHTHIDDTRSMEIVFMKTTEPIRLRQNSETSSSTTAATLTVSPKEGCLLDWIQDDSGCYFHPPSQARLCVFHDYSMAIDTSRIIVSRGGEPAWDAQGRSEQDELFQAKPNAVYLKETKPNFHTKYYQQKLLDAATNVQPNSCDISFSGLTLILERIEYANLWHIMNDWFNVHWTSETLATKSNAKIPGAFPTRVVLGHILTFYKILRFRIPWKRRKQTSLQTRSDLNKHILSKNPLL